MALIKNLVCIFWTVSYSLSVLYLCLDKINMGLMWFVIGTFFAINLLLLFNIRQDKDEN